METVIKISDLKAKNPIAVLNYLYAMSPKKVTNLVAIQGYEITDKKDVENLGQMIIDREAKFNLNRLVSALKITSKEIINSKNKVRLID